MDVANNEGNLEQEEFDFEYPLDDNDLLANNEVMPSSCYCSEHFHYRELQASNIYSVDQAQLQVLRSEEV